MKRARTDAIDEANIVMKLLRRETSTSSNRIMIKVF